MRQFAAARGTFGGFGRNKVLRRNVDPRFGETVYRLVNVNRGEPVADLSAPSAALAGLESNDAIDDERLGWRRGVAR